MDDMQLAIEAIRRIHNNNDPETALNKLEDLIGEIEILIDAVKDDLAQQKE